jgi:3-oxoadipate enol-lactonase
VPFATLGGITLHHRHVPAEGARRTLVFINSLGTDFRIWDAVAKSLEGTYSLVFHDKRGHGLSDLGNPPYRMDDHVDDLSNLIDHLGLKKVILCGLSVGGLISLGLHARRPEIIEAMILCDTAHKIGTAETWNARIATVETQGIATIADTVLKNWFTPAFHAGRKADLAGCRNMLTRQSAAGYAGTCAAIRDSDYTQSARDVAVPALCVVGDQDGSTPPDLVRSLAELIPGSRLEVVRDAGHIPCIEQPEALVGLIDGFVGSLPSA